MKLSKIAYVNKLNATITEVYEQFHKSKIYSTSQVSYNSVSKQKHLHVFQRPIFLRDSHFSFLLQKYFLTTNCVLLTFQNEEISTKSQ